MENIEIQENTLSGAKDSLLGVVERITFHSAETGFSVVKVRPLEKSLQKYASFFSETELITVLVHQSQIFAGATCLFEGDWTHHPVFGKQFKASFCQEQKPATSAAMEKYLGSGLIKGIGPQTAKKIVQKFKEKSLEILDNSPEKLLLIKGITTSKLETIIECWQEHREIKNVMMFLQEQGVSTLFAVKIFKTYGNEAIEKVSNNPYCLAQDIYGIGFITADKIAHQLGIQNQDPRRVRAGIDYILVKSREEGHCYLFDKQIHEKLYSLQISLSLEELKHYLELLVQENYLYSSLNEEQLFCYYHHTAYRAETFVAQKILERLQSASFNKEEFYHLNSLIEFSCKERKITLSEEQKNGVLHGLSNPLFILTGGPGCGKTTTTQVIADCFTRLGKKILLAAPTGRASQRMTEVIGVKAVTIHRLLEYSPQEGGFTRSEKNPLPCDVLIVDEVSMVDIFLFSHILRSLAAHTSLILIGDPDQLPSVGAGNLLRDLLNTSFIPRVSLTQIFRQAAESLIIKTAHSINNGELPLLPSPLKTPKIWHTALDCLFIDAELATQEDFNFLKKIKRLAKISEDIQKNLIAKKDNEEILWQKISAQELNHSTKEEISFVVPPHYHHINFEKLILAKEETNESELLHSLLEKIHPYSCLQFGFTAEEMLLKLYFEYIPEHKNPKWEIQILTPMTKGPMGSLKLNKMIQEIFAQNCSMPPLKLGEKLYYVGDRVIQKKNNYDLKVFNGDIGHITQIDYGEKSLTVCYIKDKYPFYVSYKSEQIFELDLAYAITIHKSQGSEFDCVILPLFLSHFVMLQRNLIYTGVTRAKKMALFLGQKKALVMASKKIPSQKRQTLLNDRLEGRVKH